MMSESVQGGKREEFGRMIRFALTGMMNTVVDFIVYLVVSYMGMGLYLAQTLGYAAGTLNSYIVNRSWTFKSQNRFFSRELVKFVLVNLLTLGASLIALRLLQGWLGTRIFSFAFFGRPAIDLTKIVLKLPIVVLTTVMNFILSRLWVFRMT